MDPWIQMSAGGRAARLFQMSAEQPVAGHPDVCGGRAAQLFQMSADQRLAGIQMSAGDAARGRQAEARP
jgi:hypothetical protein